MRTLVVIAMMCSLMSASAAHADEEADRETARAAFAEGERLFASNDYQAALRSFQRAQQVQPHDKVRIPIATCLERLARFREALDEWGKVVASDQVEDHQKLEARRAAARLRPRLGELVVTGTPAGARVLVDEEQRCVVPCRTLVDPREHLVVVRSGSHEQTQRVTFSRGEERTIDVVLVPVSPSPPASEPLAPVETASRGPGVFMWLGLGVAVVGAAGVVGFGLHANALHDSYVATPSDALRDEGLVARALSNASIAVGAAGVVLALVDLVFLAPMDDVSSAQLTADGLRWSF